LSSRARTYLIAGLRLKIISSVGEAATFLPPVMDAFVTSGTEAADLTITLYYDEEAQADPLRRFFPPQFMMEIRDGGFSFDGMEGRRKRLGLVSAGCAGAEMGLPLLDTAWRISEEEEALREALQAFVRACLQCRLLQEGGTLVHAAAIDWEGDGFAFAGHTRAGKTTLSRGFAAECVLGDDLAAVGRGPRGFTLYGTPWPGREGGIVAYGGVPLRAVFNLHPEMDTGLYRQSPGEALADLAANAPRLGYGGEESKLLGVFSSLVETVPIYRLSLRLGDDAAVYLRRVSAEEGEGQWRRPT